MKKLSKWIKCVISGILILLIMVLITVLVGNTFALKNNQLGNFFGYTLSYVPTESMEPTIEAGDTVLIKKGNIDQVKLNDIIVYYNGERYVIHRVVEITEEGIRTKGDNNTTNPVIDSTIITSENYYGKYIKTVNYLNLQSLVKNKNYIFPMCIGVFLIILITEAVQVARTISKNSKKKIERLQREQLIEELKKEIIEEELNKKK